MEGRKDGRTVYFFGSAPGIDARTSVVVVTGDDDDVARRVSGSLAGDWESVLVQARGAIPPGPATFVGEAFDPDVWALIRARFFVRAVVVIRLGGQAFPNVEAIERWTRPGTPVLVGLPDLPGGVPVDLPGQWLGLGHPARRGLVGLPGHTSWIEEYRRSGCVPAGAAPQSFLHTEDLAAAYAAAAALLLRGHAGCMAVGPCPVWDPKHLRGADTMPAVVAVRSGSGHLPGARLPEALWTAAGRGDPA